jgi:hypothetical protein
MPGGFSEEEVRGVAVASGGFPVISWAKSRPPAVPEKMVNRLRLSQKAL